MNCNQSPLKKTLFSEFSLDSFLTGQIFQELKVTSELASGLNENRPKIPENRPENIPKIE